LRSTDAGRHWTNVTPTAAAAESLPVFFAVDDGAAWAVYSPFAAPVANGGPYEVFQTTDGAATWTRTAGTLARGAITGIEFVDRMHGWATVGMGAAAGSEAIGVLRTLDGGVSWALIAQTADPLTGQPDPGGLAFSCDKGWVTFGSSSVGLIANICAGGAPTIYRSGDGGARWTLVGLPTLGAPEIGFGNPTFLTAQDAVPPGNPIETTSDGGASWRPVPAPAPPFKAVDMQLQDLGKGIAVAWSYGAAYRTDDSAKNWRNVTPPLLPS
jgi:photosystem II stability/assembly factor-like uncharacterized protein